MVRRKESKRRVSRKKVSKRRVSKSRSKRNSKRRVSRKKVSKRRSRRRSLRKQRGGVLVQRGNKVYDTEKKAPLTNVETEIAIREGLLKRPLSPPDFSNFSEKEDEKIGKMYRSKQSHNV